MFIDATKAKRHLEQLWDTRALGVTVTIYAISRSRDTQDDLTETKDGGTSATAIVMGPDQFFSDSDTGSIIQADLVVLLKASETISENDYWIRVRSVDYEVIRVDPEYIGETKIVQAAICKKIS